MALLASGCKPSGNDSAAGNPVTVKWAFILPTSWDPVTSRTGADINTISLAYASLTRLDKQGKVEPALAKAWHYSQDGTALTFDLRDGLTFTDGTVLDAAAVKAFFERGKTQTDSFLKDPLADIASISVEAPTEVTFHLSEPDYQLPYVLAGRTGAIASPAAAQKDLAKLSLWPVGAGPFKMEEFVPEAYAHLVKNPDYWDAANIHIDRLELTFQPDSSTLVAGILSGAIDLALLPAPKVKEARANGLTVTIAPSLWVRYVSINLNKPPFNNEKVVEAFRYAFNRQEFVDVIDAGVGGVSHQPFPPGYFAFNPDVETLWDYDPDRAAKLLAEAGYPPGSLSIVITSNGRLDGGASELAQAQLARIGVKSTIKVIASGSSTWQSETYIAKNPQLALDGTIGRESPVDNLLASYGPNGIMNLSAPHASEAFLQAIATVRKTPTDDPNYQRVLWDAVRIGVEQSPSDYIHSIPWILVSRPGLKNLNVEPSQIRWEGVTVQ